MRVLVAGGVDEHGRNCFFVDNTLCSFILDCGILAGSSTPYPHLSLKEIKQAKYLFITHSHADHTGAYHWLVENGFKGQAVLTQETHRQLGFNIKNSILIDKISEPLECTYLNGLNVTWGCTGHCLGSIWFRIDVAGESILYTGDYIEDTLMYQVNPIRQMSVNHAIIDTAYGDDLITPQEYRTLLQEKIISSLTVTNTIVFPVPKYGRNLELLLLLSQHFPEVTINADEFLIKELQCLSEKSTWLNKKSLAQLEKIINMIRPIKKNAKGFIFLSDPQLKDKISREIVVCVLENKGEIFLTGGTDSGSFSKELLTKKKAILCRYAVHQNKQSSMALTTKNNFKETIFFHH